MTGVNELAFTNIIKMLKQYSKVEVIYVQDVDIELYSDAQEFS